MPNQSTKILGVTGLTSRRARLPNRRRTAWRSGGQAMQGQGCGGGAGGAHQPLPYDGIYPVR